MHICIHTYIHINISTYIYLHISIYKYIQKHIHIHIHTKIYLYTYKCIYIHTYIYIYEGHRRDTVIPPGGNQVFFHSKTKTTPDDKWGFKLLGYEDEALSYWCMRP